MEGRSEETLKRERPEATEGEEMEEPFYEMVTEAVTNIGTIRKGAAETYSQFQKIGQFIISST